MYRFLEKQIINKILQTATDNLPDRVLIKFFKTIFTHDIVHAWTVTNRDHLVSYVRMKEINIAIHITKNNRLRFEYNCYDEDGNIIYRKDPRITLRKIFKKLNMDYDINKILFEIM